MNNPDRYYQPSGGLQPAGILTMFGLSLLAAVLLGLLYGVVAYYNPFIYLSFLGAWFLSIGLGIVVNTTSVWGKVSDKRLVIGASVLTGLVGLYAAWVGWLYAVMDYETVMLNPSEILSFIELAGAVGFYEIFGSTPTGWALYGIWVAEAAIIAGGTIWNVLGVSNPAPLCDDCGEWTDQEVITPAAEVVRDPGAMARALEARSLSVLTDLKHNPFADRRRTEVLVHQCKNCKGPRYLSVYDVQMTYDDEGNESVKVSSITKNLIINSSEYDALKSWQTELTEAAAKTTDDVYGKEDEAAE